MRERGLLRGGLARPMPDAVQAPCVFVERRVGSITMCAVESVGLRNVIERYCSVRRFFVCVGIYISIAVTARPWLNLSLMKGIAGN